MMKLFLLILSVFLFPLTLNARTQASGRSQATTRTIAFTPVANAVDFDGATRLSRGAAFTGATNDKQGTFSAWVKIQGNGAFSVIFRSNASNRPRFLRDTGANFSLEIRDCASAAGYVAFSDANTLPVEDVWHNILASWDLSVSTRHHIFIDNVDVENLTFFIDVEGCWTPTDWGLGALLTGSDFFDGCMTEVYLNTSEYIDFSIPENRHRFIDVNNRAVDLGINGNKPTGMIPTVYLNGNATNFGTNQGTGGNFSVQAGTLTNCDDQPASADRPVAANRSQESC